MLKHCGTTEIKTERLLLRQFKITDAEDMLKYWISYSETQARYLDRVYTTQEDVENLLSEWINNYKNEWFYKWAIIEAESGYCIGQVALWFGEGDSCMPEYCIGDNFQRRGYMTEAFKAVLEFAFMELNVERIDIATRSVNISSQKVIYNCGFRHIETDKNALYEDGVQVDRYLYLLTKSEWVSNKILFKNFTA